MTNPTPNSTDALQVVTFRPFAATDEEFVYATWLRGLYYGSPFYRQIHQPSYFRNYKHVVKSILEKATVRVACLKDDPDVILGYAVYRSDVLDWVFVKTVWRKFGIAKNLIPQTVRAVTHLTQLGKAIKPPEWIFDPFLI